MIGNYLKGIVLIILTSLTIQERIKIGKKLKLLRAYLVKGGVLD